MYTTVKNIHVALDVKIQQISSNRKKSILPQQIDMILNDAVEEFVNTRVSNKLNVRKVGLEEEVKRYDDILELKREYFAKLYVDTAMPNRMYTLLPSDYLSYISSTTNVVYDKRGMFPELKEYYYTVGLMYLHDMGLDGNNIIININDRESDYPNVYKATKTDNGKFYIFNTIVDKYRSFGYNAYLNDFKGKYLNGHLFVTDYMLKELENNEHVRGFYTNVKTKAECPDRFTYYYEDVKIYPTMGDLSSPNDLLTSEEIRDILSNHYGAKARYNNPAVDMLNGQIRVYHDKHFVPTDIMLTYIKKPRLINIDTGTMCDLTINDDIIEIAARKAVSYLGQNNTYQTRAAEQVITQ
jgi:hypothetical protein